jgi:hypothetical protein
MISEDRKNNGEIYSRIIAIKSAAMKAQLPMGNSHCLMLA